MTLATEKESTRRTTGISQHKTIKQIVEHQISDKIYRQSSLTLTASENHASYLVRLLAATSSGTFYHFFAPYVTKPGEWFFPDSAARKDTTQQLREQGKALFKSQTSS